MRTCSTRTFLPLLSRYTRNANANEQMFLGTLFVKKKTHTLLNSVFTITQV